MVNTNLVFFVHFTNLGLKMDNTNKFIVLNQIEGIKMIQNDVKRVFLSLFYHFIYRIVSILMF